MIADVVVAILDESTLANVLPAVHRSSLGHLARVLRPTRGPLRPQLTRAGVPTGHAPDEIDGAEIVLLITAAARSSFAGQLAMRCGARRSWVVSTDGLWIEPNADVILDQRRVVPAAEPPRFVPGIADAIARDADRSLPEG